ncbi:MAG: tripartite tricarboxylate transporter TctB family protein [Thermodesulfobacteriota bacterium]
MKADRISPIFWLAFGLLSAYGSVKLGLGTLREPGSGLLAFLASCFICLMAIIVLTQAFLGRGFLEQVSTLWAGTSWRRPLKVGMILLAYLFSLERLGFVFTSLAILFVMFKMVEKLSWIKAIVISTSISLGTFYMFTKILKTTLPRGFFGF